MVRGAFYGKVASAMLVSALCLSPAALAQSRNSNDQGNTLNRGTVIPVRVDDSIDATRRDNRIYSGAVAQDVRADNGSMAIPRGSKVELIVRTTNNNDLTLDIDSITVNGQRFAVRANPDQVQSTRDNSIVGSIMGAIDQGQLTGNEIRVPRDAVVTFRLARSLDVGIADRGVDREGHHYHDYYDDRDQNRNNSDQYNRNNDRYNRDNDQNNRDNDRYNRQDR